MSGFRCNDCDCEFSEETAEFRHYRSDYCLGEAVLRGKMICPECGSSDIVPLKDCRFCDEWSDEDLCPTCKEKAEDICRYASEKWGLNANALADLLYLYSEMQG